MDLRFWRHGKKNSDASDVSDISNVSDVSDIPDPASGTPQSIQPTLPRAAVIVLALGGAAAAVFGIWSVRSIVAPVSLALVLTICAYPIRALLVRIRVRRGLATIVAILLVFAMVAGFIAALLVALTQFMTLLPQFAPQIAEIGENIGIWLASIGVGPESVQAIVAGFDTTKFADVVTGLLGGVTGIVFALVVLLTMLMLMAMDATYLPTVFSELGKLRPALVSALVGFGVGVRRYMVAATGLGVLQSTLNFIALVALQVPAPLLWSLLAFICSYIPNVGYFIAIVPPTLFGLLAGGPPTAIAVIVAYGLINVVVQSVVQPLLVSNVVSLNQTITFVSVMFWALVLGPIGAVLAVPLTLLVRAIVIDADPRAHQWRPLTGDIDAARSIMRATDAANRSIRRMEKRRSNKASTTHSAT